MKRVNMKNLYPYYNHDFEVEVDDEVYELLNLLKKEERNRRERIRKNKAYYSLDREDGIENNALFKTANPEQIYIDKVMNELIIYAIRKLPEKQSIRVYAYYFMNMSVGEIAAIEGVNPSTISKSLNRGIRNLKKSLNEIL